MQNNNKAIERVVLHQLWTSLGILTTLPVGIVIRRIVYKALYQILEEKLPEKPKSVFEDCNENKVNELELVIKQSKRPVEMKNILLPLKQEYTAYNNRLKDPLGKKTYFALTVM